MPNCENCGHQIDNESAMCPECGFVSRSWSGRRSSSGAPDWLLTLLGFILGVISPFVFGIGLLIMVAVYFTTRDSHPAFARGVGWGLLSLIAVVMGAIALCFAALSGAWR